MFHRRMIAVLFAGVCLLVGTSAVQAGLTGQAFGGYGSGNTTIASDSVSGVVLQNDDTTGVHQVQNSHLLVGGVAQTHLSQNGIGAASGWIGSSNLPAEGTNFFLVSGGSTTFIDTLTVNSGSLSTGTPVQIQYSLDVNPVLSASHTLFNTGSTTNNAFASAFVQLNIQGPNGSMFLDGNDNKAIKNTTDGTDLAIGLIAVGHLDFVVNAAIGDQITYALIAGTNANGNLRPFSTSPSGPLMNATGLASSQLGVSFGATAFQPNPLIGLAPAGPAITLLSAQYNGAFPSAGSANSASAILATPSAVPEPTTALLLAVGAFLAGERRPHPS